MTEPTQVDAMRVDANRRKVRDLYAASGKVLVSPTWPSPTAAVSQVAALDDRDADFAARIEGYNQQCDALLEGFDNVPCTAFDFGGAAWLMALAYGCRLIRINDLINAAPLLHDPAGVASLRKPERIETCGLYPLVLERVAEFQRRWPHVPLTISDNQSPIDVATCVLHGETALVAMFTAKEALHRLLDMVTDSVIEINRHLQRAIGNFGGFMPGTYLPAGMHVSDDDAAFLSPATYREFAVPYAERIADAFGGIQFHCCMAYEQNLAGMAACRGFMGFDPQADYNAPGKVLDAIRGRGGVWSLDNCPWQKRPDRPHDDEDMFKRMMEASDGVCGLRITVWGEDRDQAIALAAKVKDYAVRTGRS